MLAEAFDAVKDLPLPVAIVIASFVGAAHLVRAVRPSGNGKLKSGDQDPAYWELKFREIVREELEGYFRRKGL